MREKVFVLGADDPEMRRIRDLVIEAGYLFLGAEKDGVLVHAGNAYEANNAQEIPNDAEVIFVECCVLGTNLDFIIDHHNPGDPGYGKGPELYWEASSIGQLYKYLDLGVVPDDDRVLAAMDHCFNAAVKGECPGVLKYRVLDIKTRMIAKSTEFSEDVVRSMIGKHVEMINQANRTDKYDLVDINGQKVIIIPDTGIGYTADYLAAQVAAVIQGVPVIILSREEEGGPGRYHLCGDTTPELVISFMEEWAYGLVRIYGNPERGYAGGYEDVTCEWKKGEAWRK